MPSGSKKRKAAKKKQENQPQGGDYVNQDDKDSDVRVDGERIHERENTSVEGVKIEAVEEKKIDSVERKFRIEEVSNEKDGRFEHRGNSSSGSSSSSDDESHVSTSSRVEEGSALVVESVNAAADSNMVTVEEIDKSVDLSEESPSEQKNSNEKEYVEPIENTENRAHRDDDSGATKSVLAPVPYPVHTTSWKNCCGLFEVFTGSGR